PFPSPRNIPPPGSPQKDAKGWTKSIFPSLLKSPGITPSGGPSSVTICVFTKHIGPAAKEDEMEEAQNTAKTASRVALSNPSEMIVIECPGCDRLGVAFELKPHHCVL